MIDRVALYALSLAGGALLAMLIGCSSMLAKATSPTFSSFVAHGGGAIVSMAIAFVAAPLLGSSAVGRMTEDKPPLWMYLGGVAGAFTVILPTMAVNGGLSLSGTIALSLVGQVVFGTISDQLGLFGSVRRSVGVPDVVVALLVLCGSTMIIFGKD